MFPTAYRRALTGIVVLVAALSAAIVNGKVSASIIYGHRLPTVIMSAPLTPISAA